MRRKFFVILFCIFSVFCLSAVNVKAVNYYVVPFVQKIKLEFIQNDFHLLNDSNDKVINQTIYTPPSAIPSGYTYKTPVFRRNAQFNCENNRGQTYIVAGSYETVSDYNNITNQYFDISALKCAQVIHLSSLYSNQYMFYNVIFQLTEETEMLFFNIELSSTSVFNIYMKFESDNNLLVSNSTDFSKSNKLPILLDESFFLSVEMRNTTINYAIGNLIDEKLTYYFNENIIFIDNIVTFRTALTSSSYNLFYICAEDSNIPLQKDYQPSQIFENKKVSDIYETNRLDGIGFSLQKYNAFMRQWANPLSSGYDDNYPYGHFYYEEEYYYNNCPQLLTTKINYISNFNSDPIQQRNVLNLTPSPLQDIPDLDETFLCFMQYRNFSLYDQKIYFGLFIKNQFQVDSEKTILMVSQFDNVKTFIISGYQDDEISTFMFHQKGESLVYSGLIYHGQLYIMNDTFSSIIDRKMYRIQITDMDLTISGNHYLNYSAWSIRDYIPNYLSDSVLRLQFADVYSVAQHSEKQLTYFETPDFESSLNIPTGYVVFAAHISELTGSVEAKNTYRENYFWNFLGVSYHTFNEIMITKLDGEISTIFYGNTTAYQNMTALISNQVSTKKYFNVQINTTTVLVDTNYVSVKVTLTLNIVWFLYLMKAPLSIFQIGLNMLVPLLLLLIFPFILYKIFGKYGIAIGLFLTAVIYGMSYMYPFEFSILIGILSIMLFIYQLKHKEIENVS